MNRTIQDDTGRYRTIQDDTGRYRTQTVDYGRLEIEEKTILMHLLERQTITRKQAVDVLGLQRTKATEILNGLVAMNLIQRQCQGQGRGTYYELKGND